MSKITLDLIKNEIKKVEHEISSLKCRELALHKAIKRANEVIESNKRFIEEYNTQLLEGEDKKAQLEEYIEDLKTEFEGLRKI